MASCTQYIAYTKVLAECNSSQFRSIAHLVYLLNKMHVYIHIYMYTTHSQVDVVL